MKVSSNSYGLSVYTIILGPISLLIHQLISFIEQLPLPDTVLGAGSLVLIYD